MENAAECVAEKMMKKFKTKPYKHQLDCLKRFSREAVFALLADMGTGKTWIIINNVADLWASGDCRGLLVFAPNGVHSNWTRLELPKHMPDWVRYRVATWTAAPNRKQQAELDHLFKDPSSEDLRILTMNHEAIQTKRGQEFAQKFLLACFRPMIAVDESDAFKNPSAARTKTLMKLKRYSQWRRIMTGTFITQSPFDAFSQFTFLDESILGTTSYYSFKAEYAEMLASNDPLMFAIRQRTGSRFNPQIVARDEYNRPKYRNLDKLSELIAPHSFRVLKKDCLDLPDKIYKTVFFQLTKEQAAVYKQVEEECRLVFESETAVLSRLTAIGKLAQVTSGYYIHPLIEEPVRIKGDNPKLDLLIDRVQRIVDGNEKVIIWARYRIEIEDIVERLSAAGIRCVEYHGGIKKAERSEAIERFERGNAQAFVGNQQAGGTGITLVAASYVVYFSNSFSLRDRLQSEDRAHRIGQNKSVTYINIVAEGTIDEATVGALMNKQDVANIVMNNDFFRR